MKKVSILLAAVASAWMIGASAEGVAVVDMKMIFATSPKVKQIKESLTKQFDPQRDKIEKMGKTLQADVMKYQKNKDVMSKADAAKAETNIASEENAFRAAQTKFQQEVFAAQNKSLESFMDQVKTSVKAVAEKDNLDLVVPNNDVLYTKGDKDITKQVLDNLK